MRIIVTGELERNRLTVFFRLLLAIPHFIWLGLWGIAVAVLTLVNWIATLVKGQSPAGLHRMLAMYVNYSAHVYAYVSIAANRFPGFVGEPGYEVDIHIDEPARQSRVSVLFRLILAVPALFLAAVLVGGGLGGNYSSSNSSSGSSSTTGAGIQAFGILAACALIAWFYSLARGRAPEGVTRLSWYSLHYAAQTYSYLLLLTDRYPNSDPGVLGVPRPAPPHPIVLRQQEDTLERSRVTVFFRLLLAFPHIVWIILWSILVVFAVIANWLITLIAGRSPTGLHNFLAAFQRYGVHVQAFITLVANPFPGFTGAPGYPVDVEIAPPEPQRRLWTAFRILLAIPALIIQSGLNVALYVVAILGWFASLFTGRMPRGLRNLGAFILRYGAQTSSFGYLLLTDRYPYAGPPA